MPEILKVPEPTDEERPQGGSTELPPALIERIGNTLESGKALMFDCAQTGTVNVKKLRNRIASLARTGALKFRIRTVRRGDNLYVWAEKKGIHKGGRKRTTPEPE